MGKISEIFNFDNIGGKIKNLAKLSCWITILLIWIAAPISFIALVSDDWTAELCWIPLVFAVIGPVFVWIGSWTMYAFGEFVEDIHAIRNKEGTTAEEKAKYEAEVKDSIAKKNDLQTKNEEQKAIESNTYENNKNIVVPIRLKNGKYECPSCGCRVKKGQETCLCFCSLDWN